MKELPWTRKGFLPRRMHSGLALRLRREMAIFKEPSPSTLIAIWVADASRVCELFVIDTADGDKAFWSVVGGVGWFVDIRDNSRLIHRTSGRSIGALVKGDGSGFAQCPRECCSSNDAWHGEWWTTNAHRELTHFARSDFHRQQRLVNWRLVRDATITNDFQDQHKWAGPVYDEVLRCYQEVRAWIDTSREEIEHMCEVYAEFIIPLATKIREAARVACERDTPTLIDLKSVEQDASSKFEPCPAISLTTGMAHRIITTEFRRLRARDDQIKKAQEEAAGVPDKTVCT